MLEALREMGGQGSTGEIAQRIHACKGFEYVDYMSYLRLIELIFREISLLW